MLGLISMTSSSPSKTDFKRISFCVVDSESFTGSPLIERSNLSSFFYSNFLDYDVSLHDLVVLVVLFKTNPRSSNSESGCKRY